MCSCVFFHNFLQNNQLTTTRSRASILAVLLRTTIASFLFNCLFMIMMEKETKSYGIHLIILKETAEVLAGPLAKIPALLRQRWDAIRL